MDYDLIHAIEEFRAARYHHYMDPKGEELPALNWLVEFQNRLYAADVFKRTRLDLDWNFDSYGYD